MRDCPGRRRSSSNCSSSCVMLQLGRHAVHHAPDAAAVRLAERRHAEQATERAAVRARGLVHGAAGGTSRGGRDARRNRGAAVRPTRGAVDGRRADRARGDGNRVMGERGHGTSFVSARDGCGATACARESRGESTLDLYERDSLTALDWIWMTSRVSSPQPRRCGSDRRRARRAAPRDPGGDVARRDGAFSRAVDGTNISRSGR